MKLTTLTSLKVSRRRSEENFRYRIGVINDFRDSFAFIDYKEYGTLKIFDACRTSGVDRKEDGSIAVFLNFKKVGQFKSKSEAVSLLKKLLAEAPCSFFDENKDVLLSDLLPGSYSGNTAVS